MDSERESQRFAERQSNFRGSAKVPLGFLSFEETPISGHLDPKNIAGLVQIFELEGCIRLDLENHIPAVISDDLLNQSLYYSQVTGNLLSHRTPPMLELPPNYILRCLHGKHRIAAAKTFLLPGNRWWTVDLYSDGLSEPLRRDIREEYANSRNFCDGDIFQQIRCCQRAQDIEGEGRWFARLSEGKRKNVRQLQRRKDLQMVRQALDNLLPYIGFWPSLPIGTLHETMNLKCPEEIEHYLNHIRVYWDKVIDGDQNLQPLIDFRTIQLLQTRNPWASRGDCDFIIDLMDRQQLFPMIQDPAARWRILNNFQNADCMIPSLYTFFEDIKWLAPCPKIIRALLPDGCRESTRRALSRCYTGVNQKAGTLRIEHSNPKFIEVPGSEVQAVDSGYQQLFLFAWRHFSELSAILPRKDVGRPKPPVIASNEQCWYRLAQLASSLGFESEKITSLQNQDPDLKMAHEFLRQARPDVFYQMSDEARIAPASEICRVLESIREPASTFPPRVLPEALMSPPVEHRCGRPFEQSFEGSKAFFYLSDIHRARQKTLSYFTVNRDIFLAFFGFQHPIGLSGTAVAPRTVDIRVESTSDVLMTEPVTQNQQTTQPQPHLEASSLMQSFGSIDSHVAREEPPDRSVQEAQAKAADDSNLNTIRDEDVHIEDAPDGATEVAAVANTMPDEDVLIEDAPDGASNATPQPIAAPPVERVPENAPGQSAPKLPEKPRLFQQWERQCKDGDVFLVDVKTLEGINYDLRASGLDKLPDAITAAANRSFFVVYKKNILSNGCLAPINPRRIRDYGKGPWTDGVVYKYVKDHSVPSFSETLRKSSELMGVATFTREFTGLGTESSEGSSTESRLRNLEEVHAKKKRTTHFPPDDLLHKKQFNTSSEGPLAGRAPHAPQWQYRDKRKSSGSEEL